MILRRWLERGVVITTLMMATACAPTAETPAAGGSSGTLRVAYFPNLTHSQALIGLSRGDFQNALGDDVTIEATLFNAGPAVIEALFANQIDLAYIGPNPAINGYVQSKGEALRIVSGATSGGAGLVVRADAGIISAADLAGKKLASPQLGGTQDVALRNYVVANGLQTVENGGNVEIVPTQNSQTLDLFKQGMIDGAWVPEPWASRLIVEGGGVLLVDERDLWPDGAFVTTHIIVSTPFLEAHRDWVKAWLRAHVEITTWEQDHPNEAKALVNSEIERLTGKKLDDQVLEQAWDRMTVTWDPISASLVESADSAFNIGFLKAEPDLTGIYDLTELNEVLVEKGLDEVQ